MRRGAARVSPLRNATQIRSIAGCTEAELAGRPLVCVELVHMSKGAVEDTVLTARRSWFPSPSASWCSH